MCRSQREPLVTLEKRPSRFSSSPNSDYATPRRTLKAKNQAPLAAPKRPCVGGSQPTHMRKHASTFSCLSCHRVALTEYMKPHKTGTLDSPIPAGAGIITLCAGPESPDDILLLGHGRSGFSLQNPKSEPYKTSRISLIAFLCTLRL